MFTSAAVRQVTRAEMQNDTDIGGPLGQFPATRHSAVLAARSADATERRRAYEALITAYWKPVYKYVRIKWRASNDEAKDLTQSFFAAAMEKRHFDRFDPGRAAFRTYLRTCLDGFVANERKARGRLKRGGGQPLLALDYQAADDELRLAVAADQQGPEEFFHQEWVRSVFGLAVEALARWCVENGKQVHFALFRAYDLDEAMDESRPTYEQLAARFELPATQVTNFLALVRRRFRELVLEHLRECTGSDDEFREEARALLGGGRA